MSRRRRAAIAVVTIAACASPSADTRPPSDTAAAAPSAPAVPRAPWEGTRLASADVPAVYRAAWREAPNRATCAPLAFRETGVTDATPRRATFSGGWAVAYDRPGTRSAFGVAGTGTLAADTADMYAWPHTIRWADGSVARYGPEGGTGPNELAYVYVEGQGCLYNVWSRLGREHLERLLSELRRVEP